MKLISSTFLLSALLLCFILGVSAGTAYVQNITGCIQSGSSSPRSPFCTLNASLNAMTSLSPTNYNYTILLLAPGVYVFPTLLNAPNSLINLTIQFQMQTNSIDIGNCNMLPNIQFQVSPKSETSISNFSSIVFENVNLGVNQSQNGGSILLKSIKSATFQSSCISFGNTSTSTSTPIQLTFTSIPAILFNNLIFNQSSQSEFLIQSSNNFTVQNSKFYFPTSSETISNTEASTAIISASNSNVILSQIQVSGVTTLAYSILPLILIESASNVQFSDLTIQGQTVASIGQALFEVSSSTSFSLSNWNLVSFNLEVMATSYQMLKINDVSEVILDTVIVNSSLINVTSDCQDFELISISGDTMLSVNVSISNIFISSSTLIASSPTSGLILNLFSENSEGDNCFLPIFMRNVTITNSNFIMVTFFSYTPDIFSANFTNLIQPTQIIPQKSHYFANITLQNSQLDLSTLFAFNEASKSTIGFFLVDPERICFSRVLINNNTFSGGQTDQGYLQLFYNEQFFLNVSDLQFSENTLTNTILFSSKEWEAAFHLRNSIFTNNEYWASSIMVIKNAQQSDLAFTQQFSQTPNFRISKLCFLYNNIFSAELIESGSVPLIKIGYALTLISENVLENVKLITTAAFFELGDYSISISGTKSNEIINSYYYMNESEELQVLLEEFVSKTTPVIDDGGKNAIIYKIRLDGNNFSSFSWNSTTGIIAFENFLTATGSVIEVINQNFGTLLASSDFSNKLISLSNIARLIMYNNSISDVSSGGSILFCEGTLVSEESLMISSNNFTNSMFALMTISVDQITNLTLSNNILQAFKIPIGFAQLRTNLLYGYITISNNQVSNITIANPNSISSSFYLFSFMVSSVMQTGNYGISFDSNQIINLTASLPELYIQTNVMFTFSGFFFPINFTSNLIMNVDVSSNEPLGVLMGGDITLTNNTFKNVSCDSVVSNFMIMACTSTISFNIFELITLEGDGEGFFAISPISGYIYPTNLEYAIVSNTFKQMTSSRASVMLVSNAALKLMNFTNNTFVDCFVTDPLHSVIEIIELSLEGEIAFQGNELYYTEDGLLNDLQGNFLLLESVTFVSNINNIPTGVMPGGAAQTPPSGGQGQPIPTQNSTSNQGLPNTPNSSSDSTQNSSPPNQGPSNTTNSSSNSTQNTSNQTLNPPNSSQNSTQNSSSPKQGPSNTANSSLGSNSSDSSNQTLSPPVSNQSGAQNSSSPTQGSSNTAKSSLGLNSSDSSNSPQITIQNTLIQISNRSQGIFLMADEINGTIKLNELSLISTTGILPSNYGLVQMGSSTSNATAPSNQTNMTISSIDIRDVTFRSSTVFLFRCANFEIVNSTLQGITLAQSALAQAEALIQIQSVDRCQITGIMNNLTFEGVYGGSVIHYTSVTTLAADTPSNTSNSSKKQKITRKSRPRPCEYE